MRYKYNNNKGFTLLEMTVSLILMGIIGSIWGIGFIQIVDVFLLSKYNTETAQKGQMAMTRLIKELQSIKYICTDELPTNRSIKYSRDTGQTDIHRIFFSPNQITIDGDILIDSVNDFTINYYEKYNPPVSDNGSFSSKDKIVEIILKLNNKSGIISEFKTFVFLRGVL